MKMFSILVNTKSTSGTMNSASTTTTKSTSSTSKRINNETSDLSLSEQSSFTTSPQTERKITDSKPSHVTNVSQTYYRNSSSTKSGTLSSSYSTNQSSQNSSIGFVWKPNSGRHVGGQSPADSQTSNDIRSGINKENHGKYPSNMSKSAYPNDDIDFRQNQVLQQPQENSSKQPKEHSHVNQLVNNFNKMFPQVSPDNPESKNGPSPPGQNHNDKKVHNREQSSIISDSALRDRVGSPTPQRPISNGISDSWGNSMQRPNGRLQEDDDTYYDTKYGKFGSLGRKESMGRYRKYQPTKSSSGVITFGSPRLMQRSAALKLTSDPNTNQSDNLFTDTGSPKYVNTSAILGQQPHKQRSHQQQFSKDPLIHHQSTRSPVVGRRGLQQQVSQKDNYAKQISKNLNNDFSKFGISGHNDKNTRLHPVTTIQQVLYNNGSQNANGLGAPMPHLENGYDQGPSPVQQLQPIPHISNNGIHRTDVQHNNRRLASGTAGHPLGNNKSINHNSSSSSTTSSSFIPPLQNSVESSNIPPNSRAGGDRIILERNLEKLITQKGLEVLGQLTAEMTHEQIERLLHKTKEKLASNSTSQPSGSPSDFGNFESSVASRSRRPLDIDFSRNNDLDGYLAQQLQVAPVPTNGMPLVANSHQRYGSQTSCPSWAHEGDSFNSTPSGSKTKSPDLNNLKFMPHQEMNGRIGDESSSNEDDDARGGGMKQKKGNLINNNNGYQENHIPISKKHHSKHRNDRLNASFSGEMMGAKNLSVRFDPTQDQNMGNQPMHRPTYPDYPASPYTEQKRSHLPPQGYPSPHHQRSHSTSHHHHHRHHREQKPFHQRSSSSSRPPQATSTQHLQHVKEDYHDGHPGQTNYNHQPISRSHSYSSGQNGFANGIEQQRPGAGGYHPPPQQGHNRNQSPSMMMPSAMRGQTPNTKRKHGRNVAFHDDEDGRCPTCSSDSSSDSDDDPYAYQPAPRKAYGGVRLSYVPNDRRRAKLMSDPRLEYVPRNLHANNKQHINHAVRAGSLQPQSLPAHNGQQHHPRHAPQQQQHHQQQQQHQQNGSVFPQQPNNHHNQQQHPHQTHPQTPYFPSQPGHHRSPQTSSQTQGGDPKDKDKNCVIS